MEWEKYGYSKGGTLGSWYQTDVGSCLLAQAKEIGGNQWLGQEQYFWGKEDKEGKFRESKEEENLRR